MVENTARRLGAAVSDTGPRGWFDTAFVRFLVVLNDAKGLFDRPIRFDRADDDALEWIQAGGPEPDFLCQRLTVRRQPVIVEIVSGEGTDVVVAPFLYPGVQRGGVLDVLLLDEVGELADIDIEAFVGYEPPFAEGVLVGVSQGHVFVVLVKIGERQPAGEANGLPGDVERAF